MSSQNILLEDFNQAPFSSIKTSDYKPAILKAIELALKDIEAITSSKEEPTFENTIEALEFSGKKLDRVTSIFFNINSAETNEEIQTIAQDVSPLLSEFKNDVILNNVLFKRVKKVYDQRESMDLNKEQTTLLDQKYKAFTRNGANLPIEGQQSLREIDKKLSATVGPTPRNRSSGLVDVHCRVCGKKERVNASIITDRDRYKCNKCAVGAG